MQRAWEWLAESFRQTTCGGYLAIVRILVGYHFLRVAWPKLMGRYWQGESLPRQMAEIAGDPISWHREFILDVVLPNPVFFSYLVCFGEVAIGISLVLGCLVRLSAPFAAFHNLNIYLAVAIPGGQSAQIGVNRLFIFLHLIFAIASAGRSLGIDGWLKQKFPRSLLF